VILKRLWKNICKAVKRKETFPISTGCVITEAFHDGTEQCYQLHDMFNTFTRRGMDALAVYEQWNMRCSREFLLQHTKAMNAVLTSNPVSIVKIINLNNILIERLEWPLPTEEIIWQFMAVAYFDKHESPYKYDDKYGKEKIKRWKAKGKIEDFFLSAPLGDLIPLPQYSKGDLQDYMSMIQKMDSKQLEMVTSLLSQSRPKKGS